MAALVSSYYCRCSSVSARRSISTTRVPSSSNSASPVSHGNSLGRLRVSQVVGFRARAKFEKFQDETLPDDLEEISEPPEEDQEIEDDEEDDSCLPSNLEGAVRQSGQASSQFVSSGGMRAIVELLIPQLQFLDDEGAQAELWELSRIFIDTLIGEMGCQVVDDLYDRYCCLDIQHHRNFMILISVTSHEMLLCFDAGAAALLKYKWKDAAFGFASLSDRKPVENEDEVVVMVVPDYQMLEYVEKIASALSDDPPRPLIMWNPRLISEDVGVGYNVRKLRRYFLSTFTTVYSMKPLPSGAVFRCYPGLWKVFYDDNDRVGRYLLAKEMIARPDAEDLEIIFGKLEESAEGGQGPSFFDQAASILSSLNRFMKAISK